MLPKQWEEGTTKFVAAETEIFRLVKKRSFMLRGSSIRSPGNSSNGVPDTTSTTRPRVSNRPSSISIIAATSHRLGHGLNLENRVRMDRSRLQFPCIRLLREAMVSAFFRVGALDKTLD